MARWAVFPEDDEPSKQAAALAEQVEKDGGHALAIYREPVGDHWQIFCLLPMAKVEPTPYQRDLSPTHVKRLLEVVKKIDRFVDPIVVMSVKPGLYWTPNGNHRRAVLEKLKAKMVPAIVDEADEALGRVVAKLKKRGINHPYVKTFVLARATPLTRQRKTLPSFDQTFKKLRESLEAFDPSKVRYEDIQRAAV